MRTLIDETTEGEMQTKHAKVRAQQRGIPPLIGQWLDDYGDDEYTGTGGLIRFFSRQSIRKMEHDVGHEPVRRFSDYLHAYKVIDARDGHVITIGFRTKHIRRK